MLCLYTNNYIFRKDRSSLHPMGYCKCGGWAAHDSVIAKLHNDSSSGVIVEHMKYFENEKVVISDLECTDLLKCCVIHNSIITFKYILDAKRYVDSKLVNIDFNYTLIHYFCIEKKNERLANILKTNTKAKSLFISKCKVGLLNEAKFIMTQHNFHIDSKKLFLECCEDNVNLDTIKFLYSLCEYEIECVHDIVNKTCVNDFHLNNVKWLLSLNKITKKDLVKIFKKVCNEFLSSTTKKNYALITYIYDLDFFDKSVNMDNEFIISCTNQHFINFRNWILSLKKVSQETIGLAFKKTFDVKNIDHTKYFYALENFDKTIDVSYEILVCSHTIQYTHLNWFLETVKNVPQKTITTLFRSFCKIKRDDYIKYFYNRENFDKSIDVSDEIIDCINNGEIVRFKWFLASFDNITHIALEQSFRKAYKNTNYVFCQFLYDHRLFNKNINIDDEFIDSCSKSNKDFTDWLLSLNKITTKTLSIAFRKSCKANNLDFTKSLYYLTSFDKNIDISDEVLECFDKSQYDFLDWFFVSFSNISKKILTKIFRKSYNNKNYEFCRKLYNLSYFDKNINIDDEFIDCCVNNNLDFAIWLYRTNYNNKEYGFLENVKMCFGSNNIYTNNDAEFIIACEKGYLNIVSWLYSLDNISQIGWNRGFFAACKNSLDILKWYHSVEQKKNNDISEKLNQGFKECCLFGNLENAKWLYSVGSIDIHMDNNILFKKSGVSIVSWLLELKK